MFPVRLNRLLFSAQKTRMTWAALGRSSVSVREEVRWVAASENERMSSGEKQVKSKGDGRKT